MIPYKRIEVITNSVELATIERKLSKAGITGYTVIRDVIGHGSRGRNAGDELTGVFTNICLVIACPESDLEKS
ncbi:MAG: hypothetical protein HC904_06265 [Blastochloris sp.]|nr:hypothetical protein [Blastochloris sp.]